MIDLRNLPQNNLPFGINLEEIAALQSQYPEAMVQRPTTQSSSAVEEALASRKAIINDLTTALANKQMPAPGISDAEKYWRMAAALGKIGKTGHFSESLGSLAEEMGTMEKERRALAKEQEARDLQRLMSRSELATQQYGLAKDEQTRSTIEQYLAGKGPGATTNTPQIPDDMKALILSLPPEKAIATIIDMDTAQKTAARTAAGAPGKTVSVNEKTGEIVVVDKVTGEYDVLRDKDIPLDVRQENMKDAIARSKSYPPELRPAMIAKFAAENNAAYVQANLSKPATTKPATTKPAEAITPETQPKPPKVAATTTATKPAEIKALPSYFTDYVKAPERAVQFTGELTPQQDEQFKAQMQIDTENAKTYNKKVDAAAESGAKDVAAANQLLLVAPKISNTGTLAPFRREIGNLLSSLGFGANIINDSNALSVATAAVNLRTLGAQLEQAGVQTQSDAMRMEAAGPTITQPKDAFTYLSRYTKAVGERKLEMSNFRQEWRKHNVSDVGMGDAWTKYINDTPLTATMPNGKIIFANEYIDKYMAAHPNGTKTDAITEWRRAGGLR